MKRSPKRTDSCLESDTLIDLSLSIHASNTLVSSFLDPKVFNVYSPRRYELTD